MKLLIRGNDIRAFNWCRNRLPWMILNGVIPAVARYLCGSRASCCGAGTNARRPFSLGDCVIACLDWLQQHASAFDCRQFAAEQTKRSAAERKLERLNVRRRTERCMMKLKWCLRIEPLFAQFALHIHRIQFPTDPLSSSLSSVKEAR